MGCALSRLRHKRARCYEVDCRQLGDGQADTRAAGQQGAADDRPRSTAAPAQEEGGSPAPVQPSTAAQQAAAGAPTTTSHKAKLDPKDFMFTGLQSQTRVKLPGSVKGQQFVIDNCKDCDLFVMDHCASVTLDDCTNCRVFIGPTEASVFMRDCHGCSLAAISRQLRCRDCTACNLLLCCRTRPIIESSSGMAFGCCDLPYAGLAAQMAAAQLSPFHNFWTSVFDFTPQAAAAAVTPAAGAGGAGAAGAQQAPNWGLLPADASVQQLLGNPSLPEEVQRLAGICAADGTAPAAEACGELATSRVVAGDAAATAQDAAAGAEHPARPAAARLQEDRMCVIRTCRQQQDQLGPHAGDSSILFLFVLFPVGQHAAALQWVHNNIQQQQQQEQQHAIAAAAAGDDLNAAAATAGAGAEAEAAADACPADVTVSCSADGDGAVTALAGAAAAAAAAAAAVTLQHTNEASVPAAVLQQIATAAGWSKQQLKQLGVTAAANGKSGAACVVGLEVACSSEEARQRLCSTAEAAGALCCTSAAAAALFRDLGVDG